MLFRELCEIAAVAGLVLGTLGTVAFWVSAFAASLAKEIAKEIAS